MGSTSMQLCNKQCYLMALMGKLEDEGWVNIGTKVSVCGLCGILLTVPILPNFHTFISFRIFQLAYRRLVVTDAREQLCKDFCITTNCGEYLILASQTPQQQPNQQPQRPVPGGLPGVPCMESTTLHTVSEGTDLHMST